MSEIYDEDERRVIAGRARTLHERLEAPESFEVGERGDSRTETVFEEWRDQFPNDAAFDRRLEQAGVTGETCRHALSTDEIPAGETVPAWVDELEELVATVQAQSLERISEVADSNCESLGDRPADDWLFGPVATMISEYACDRLDDEGVTDQRSAVVVESMADWFRDQFETRFWRVPFAEFKGNVAAHDSELAAASPDEFEDPPTDYYEQFLGYLFSGGFASLCKEYPMFSRLLVTQVRNWVEFVREFFERLQADRERLADRFGVERTVETVVDVEPLTETTFDHGRTVVRVEFDCGLVLAYKPRSVEAGATFYRILDRLNDHLPVPDFETPTFLGGDDYGWMEWVEQDECDSEAAVERYYRRAGALGCVAYLLDLTDCSFENLVAAGERPLLVDVETALHPYVGADRKPMETGLGSLRDDSVLSTLLLPCAFDGLYSGSEFGNTPTELSGLGVASGEATLTGTTEPVVEGANTDVMTVERATETIDRERNVPKLDGEDRPPADYLQQLTDGFERTYETILEMRDDGRLFDEVELIRAFESVETRLVYRSWYTRVLDALTARDSLRDGARFGVAMERFAVPFCDGQVTDPPWSLYETECSALKRLEKPRFTCPTDGTEIQTRNGRTDAETDSSGIARLRERVESASRTDARRQVELIRGCFRAVPTPSLDAESNTRTAAKSSRVTDERLRREATEQFERICTTSLRSADGTRHWSSVGPWAETERLTLRPVDESLAAGRCGIALFGAGLHRITGQEQYRTIARETIRPLRERVRSGSESLALTNHGGALGVGSVAYGLGTVGELLGDEAILEDAVRTVDFVSDASFGDYDSGGVFRGVAGTTLGLLSVYERTDSPAVRRAAIDCGDHLVDTQVATEKRLRAATVADERQPRFGFGDGSTGVAYALLRLWDATGDRTYRNAAFEALERVSFERTSGIGLAPLGIAEYATDERVESVITRAVATAQSDRLEATDDIRYGNAGRIEFLLEAERRGERTTDVHQLLGKMLDQKEENGGYCTAAKTTTVVDPTFCYGLSGIGYAMLRAIAPESLPCALLWE